MKKYICFIGLILIIFFACSCSPEKKGFELMTFKSINDQFDSLIDESVKNKVYESELRVYFLRIESANPLIFCISSYDVNNISSSHKLY
jgi:hypothetical protein